LHDARVARGGSVVVEVDGGHARMF
jgi:hypothetical protein